MPAYDFICETCGETFERVAHFNENVQGLICPNGHSHVRRLYSAPAVVYKGSGFYTTDHRSKKDRSADN